jgi:hypothetical protein
MSQLRGIRLGPRKRPHFLPCPKQDRIHLKYIEALTEKINAYNRIHELLSGLYSFVGDALQRLLGKTYNYLINHVFSNQNQQVPTKPPSIEASCREG